MQKSPVYAGLFCCRFWYNPLMSDNFDEAYNKLNTAQRQAVDAIDGPVMVVAGPGTGKTQILALRIANILKKTDTPPDGILCLTFTNSGVRAMRKRLAEIIGPTASRVSVLTFHSFGSSLLDEFYEVLSFDAPPVLLDDTDAMLLADEILEENEWEYLRPRSGGAHNFRDLKSIISLLKRERMKPEDFLKEIEKDSEHLSSDESNISSRGPSKGELKKEVSEKIERLKRTAEVVRFYELYEAVKEKRGLADYDDILELCVRLIEKSADVRDTLRERYLYALVDEHQDSSGVQNQFLEAVWGGVEKPNLFVVGDDRQLIYGFGGASLSHFERFRETFAGTKLIALTENYRSTQAILDSADALLSSALVEGKLSGTKENNNPVALVEAEYPRDEIIAAGLAIKKAIARGTFANECAVLVPKNAQVKSAITILSDLGLPVASGGKASFFTLAETQALINILRLLSSPYDASRIAQLLLDSTFGIPVLTAHKFLKEYGRAISIETLQKGEKEIAGLGQLLIGFSKQSQNIYNLVQEIGEKLFFKRATEHRALLREIEVVRTMLHLVLMRMEKPARLDSRSGGNPKLTLAEFIAFLDRMETYGEDIPLAVFSSDEGVKVMTLHASKGLEFEFVWIAHLDEKSLMKGKHLAFTLPEAVSEKVSKKDELTAKRELYVAITRAKRFCTLSYANANYTGMSQTLARIIAELPKQTFEKTTFKETEEEIIAHDPKAYIASAPLPDAENALEEITDFVKEKYADTKVAVTHLNNFFSCPWKWYFRNFLRLPEPESESLQFGNLMHYSIKELLEDRTKNKKDLPDILEIELTRMHIYDSRVRSRFMKDGTPVLTRFMQDRLPGISAGARSEEEPKPYRDLDIPAIEISGKIDLIETLADETLQVTDFKTGAVKTAREIEKKDNEGRLSDMMRQLAMYSYLLMHQKEKEDVSLSQLLFLEAETREKNALYKTHIAEEQIALLRKDIADYDKLLSSGEWTDRPCNFKPFGQKKECEYCKLAEAIK